MLSLKGCLVTFLVALAMVSGRSVSASEGLFLKSNSMPAALQKAWDSVFHVLVEQPSSYLVGTAFLARKTIRDDVADLYFVTNYHVFKIGCPAVGPCANMALAQEVDLKTNNGKARVHSRSGLTFSDVRVERFRKNPDLALLHVRVQGNLDIIPDALKFSKSCALRIGESLYTLGFPLTHLRVSSHAPTEDPSTTRKRWSRGVFTGYAKYDYQDGLTFHYWASSSVDMLEGNSGGPLLNEGGEVVGVMKGAKDEASNGSRYSGNENLAHLDWNSVAVRCEYFPEFLDGIDVRFSDGG